jgi:transcriptional regulator with XRE-family HTH domain
MDHDPLFREVIKQVRKRLGWTQESLALKINCSRSLIATMENGAMPTEPVFRRLLAALSNEDGAALRKTPEARQVLGTVSTNEAESEQVDDDMIERFMSFRRSRDVDLSGQWNAAWLTTVNGQENRNREIVHVRKRWNATWVFSNDSVSEDNPDGGYLWVARMELFDNKHLLGYYCAREPAVLAKGTLCLELQPNGREILGVWDGLNFDTMWAHGLVAFCRSEGRNADPGPALDRFIIGRPKMPY